ncbi:hypothetical protein Tco_1010427, partial [Tanacetum coccineum]
PCEEVVWYQSCQVNHDEVNYNLWYQSCQVNHDEMVTTRRNSDDDVPNFEAMINAAVANALPNLTAALRNH